MSILLRSGLESCAEPVLEGLQGIPRTRAERCCVRLTQQSALPSVVNAYLTGVCTGGYSRSWTALPTREYKNMKKCVGG